MKRKVSEAQERLWSEDTVALDRVAEAKSERVEPARRHPFVAINQRRQRARVLAGCAVALAFTAAAVAILGGGNKGSHTARQPAPSEIRSAGQRTEPRIRVLRVPRAARRRRGHSRHRIAKRPGHHRKRSAAPAPETEPAISAQPAEVVEVLPEASAAPPTSPPAPESVAPAAPTPPSTEFGIEGNGN